jgi:hypothetical protein
MARTAVANSSPITLSPLGPTTGTSFNPVYTACDPTNGNFFVATGRDLVSFYCAPADSAPAWDPAVTYTAGQVVNRIVISPPSSGAYIALSNVSPNRNQDPSVSPTFWELYVDGESTITLLSAPDECTGRKADVNNYVVPIATEVNPGAEFTVYPSSVFTQANGQFQFTANTNLVSVYVRNF